MPHVASIGTYLPCWANPRRRAGDGEVELTAKRKGRPYCATGVAQCVERFEQVRGMAVNQVDGARIGLAHNIGGLTAVSAVTIVEGGGGDGSR